MFQDLLQVDEEAIQRAPVRDTRQPAAVARVFQNKSDECNLNESAVDSAQAQTRELTSEVAAVSKQVAELKKIGDVPAKIANKLASLTFRLETSKNAEQVQTRIAKARRENLASWLGEGSPTNAELIEVDKAHSRALAV